MGVWLKGNTFACLGKFNESLCSSALHMLHCIVMQFFVLLKFVQSALTQNVLRIFCCVVALLELTATATTCSGV